MAPGRASGGNWQPSTGEVCRSIGLSGGVDGGRVAIPRTHGTELASRPIELILAKQWAGLLVTPVLLFDGEGTLLYYNENAEILLGRSFGLTGPMRRSEWAAAFQFEDLDGQDLDADQTPIGSSLDGAQADQMTLSLRGIAGALTKIRLTTVPIQGAGNHRHGVLAFLTPVT